MKKVLSIIGMLAIAFTLSFGVGSGSAAAQSCSLSTSDIFYQEGIAIEIERSGCGNVEAVLTLNVTDASGNPKTITPSFWFLGEDGTSTELQPSNNTVSVQAGGITEIFIPLQFGDNYDYTVIVNDNGQERSRSSSAGTF